MFWIPLGAGLAAVTFAVIVLGFAGYELRWKTRRLREDLARVQGLQPRLDELAGGIRSTQRRAAQAGARIGAGVTGTRDR